ncbi:RTA1 like protein-domain-containing protein [Biscogniauxia mediterranea]|nr:RTA1 like protein-domain-containing protein [Biscogniauxia mediterranea]
MFDVDVALASCDFYKCPISSSPYGYQPSATANGIFVAIFTTALVTCLIYIFSKRKWVDFSICMLIACVFEIVGFAARLWSSFSPWDTRLFAVSISFLTVAPAFSTAGIYTAICETITILGAEHSPIEPTRYLQLIWVEGAGFVVQLIGIAAAFLDLSATTGLDTTSEKGTRIMAVGVGLQAVSIACFIAMFTVVIVKASFMHRHFGYTTFHYEHGFVPLTRKFKIFLVMMTMAAICLLARAVFQTILLSSGFGSGIAKNEAMFTGFNGFLVALSVVGLTTAHPASFLQDGLKEGRLYRSDSDSILLQRPRPCGTNHHQHGEGVASFAPENVI